jgi:hypothetical protein
LSEKSEVNALLGRLKNILNEIRDPQTDIDKALTLLEESTLAFKKLLEEIEVDNYGGSADQHS